MTISLDERSFVRYTRFMKLLKLLWLVGFFYLLTACDKPVETSTSAKTTTDQASATAKSSSAIPRSIPTVISDEFSGPWDTNLATPILERQLDRVVWLGKNVGCEGTCDLRSEIVKEFDLAASSGVEKLVLMTSNDTSNTCHACAPAISLFRFRKTANGWKLADSDMAFANLGANGKINGDRPMLASVQSLSESQIALLIEFTDARQGFQETYQFVYVSKDGKFLQAFKEKIGEDFSGVNAEIKNAGTVWSSKVELELTNDAKVLLLNAEGKRAGKVFKSVKRYSFDGKMFVPIK
jgi:hypothetical protein